MKKFVSAVALAALGAGAVLGGCNGDNNGGPGPVPAPIFTATPGATGVPTTAPTAGPTAAPTATATQSFAAPVRFPNGQNGTLNLRVAGAVVTGNVVVRALGASRLSAQTSFAVAAGTYSISGTFTPPRGFSVRGSFPAPIGAFTFTGTIPTATQPGAYTFTGAGQTTSGVIPIPGTTPTPTATAMPTATQPGASNGTLVFTAGAGYNGISGAASNFGYPGFDISPATVTLASGFFRGSLIASTPALGRLFNFSTTNGDRPITQGLSLPIRPASNLAAEAFSITYAEVPPANSNATRGWVANGGSVLFESITANRITLRLRDVTFAPAANTPLARGTFTLNGSATFAHGS